MSESTPDLASLLQTLVQQQTALLQVHTESVRLQRVLIEHLVGGPSANDVVHERRPAEPAPVAGIPLTAATAQAPLQPTSAPPTPRSESADQTPIAPVSSDV